AVGGVRRGLPPKEGAAAAAKMRETLTSGGFEPTGYVVQAMAGEGVEMIVGVVHDPQFGPVIACGAGGVLVELMKDVAVRLTPLSRRDAEEMLEEIRTRPLLTGYRGSPPRDIPALVDAILRVSALVEDLPQIQELDLNPIRVHERGTTIVDARIRIAPAAPEALIGARR